jgi:hypothetical protein
MLAITGTPDQVLRQLLVRSGLLRRPSAETLDFVHRTFQDYLAAKAAVEDENLGVLVRNAHDDQWDDVLRMAVGHARPRERVKILSALLAEAEKQPRYRDRLRLLAANCLEHATELDPGIRERVTEAATTLIPPRDDETAKELATAGALVLDLLPGPDGLDDQTARAVVITALEVADSRAIPLLRRYATHPSVGVRGQLARAWERFDTREYGEQVIARLAYDDGLRFVARSAEQLAFLQHHGGRPTIECSGPLGNEDLEHLPSGIRELRIHDTPHGLDLGAILRRSAPGSLWLSNCTGEISLAPLAGSALDSLYLHWNTQLGDPGALRGADQLRTLAVAALADSPEERLAGLALPPGLTALYVGLFHTPMTELRTLLGTVPELENLFVSAERFPVRMRSPLRTLHRLRRLRVLREDLRHLQTQRPLPAVTELQLLLPTGLEALGLVAESYPNLRSLRLEGQGMRHLGPHVRRALVRLHGCEVELYHHHAPVTPSIFGIGLHFVPTITTFTIP